MDTYAAFDFFVTADHMLDWILPDYAGQSQAQARKLRREGNRLLQVASHLGNGAKHFRVTARHHTAVNHADLDDGSLEHAYTLADALLAYWRKELGT
jgi:hypothetical protein